MSHHDVVVVGAGLAGLSAAVAARGGRRARARAGQGRRRDAPRAGDDRRARLRARARRAPLRGAGRLARDPTIRTRHVGADGVRAAVAWFKDRIASGSLRPTPTPASWSENLLLPTAVGALAPVGGRARDDGRRRPARRRARCCVVGLPRAEGLPPGAGGRQPAAARRRQARAVELDLRPEGRADANALALRPRASTTPRFRGEVDRPARRRAAARRRAGRAARGARARRPARGLGRDARTGSARPVFEIPTLPPSVPGHAGLRHPARARCAARAARVILNNVVDRRRARPAGG